MSPMAYGTGFATMPRGLSAEVELDRYYDWKAAQGTFFEPKPTRIRLSGGPFDGWAWDAAILPDRFISETGEYRPTTTTAEDGIYLWRPG